MNPVLRVLAAAFLAAGVVLVGAPVQADTAAGPAARADGDEVVFTGRFVRRLDSGTIAPVGDRAFQVEVDLVYGPVSVPRKRVTVVAGLPIEKCPPATGVGAGTAGQTGQSGTGVQPIRPRSPQGQAPSSTSPTSTTEPTSGPTTGPTGSPSADPEPTDPSASPEPLDTLPRIFRATVTVTDDGPIYEIASCDKIDFATDDALVDLVADLGDGRAPGVVEQPAVPPAKPSYQCGTSTDAAELDSPESCSALVDTPSFDRAAAPGLALVIVGLLGFVVVRRVGKRP